MSNAETATAAGEGAPPKKKNAERKKCELPARIFSYGCSEPTENLEAVIAQMRGGLFYRNKLVEAEHAYMKARGELVRALEPLCVEDDKAVEAAYADLKAYRELIGEQNVLACAKSATEEQQREIAAMEKAAKKLGAAAKKRRVEVYKREEFIDGIAPTTQAYYALKKQLRKECDLYWGSYTAVEDSLKATSKTDGTGKKVAIIHKFKRWDGTGRVAVQIQKSRVAASACTQRERLLAEEARAAKAANKKPTTRKSPVRKRTPPTIIEGMRPADAFKCDGTLLRLELQPLGQPMGTPERLQHYHHGPNAGTSKLFPARSWVSTLNPKRLKCVARLRIGSVGRKPLWTTVTFVMHRSLPPCCRIKRVWLIRKKCGSQWDWAIQFQIVSEAGFDKDNWATDGVVAFDVGWRELNGGLRVARWRGSDGRSGEIAIPEHRFTGWSKADEIQRTRDEEFNLCKSHLAVWYRDNAKQLPDELREELQHLHAFKSPRSLVRVITKWRIFRRERGRENEAHFDDVVYRLLEHWRWHDRHLWDYVEHLEQKSIRRRNDYYRSVIRELSRYYATAVIEDINLQAKVPEIESSSNCNRLRKNKRVAAVGYFLTCVKEGFRNTQKICANYTTQRCHVCGAHAPFEDKAALIHTCESCGAEWDRDVNAAEVILKLATGEFQPLQKHELTPLPKKPRTPKKPRKPRGR